jgi:hypothetical protein
MHPSSPESPEANELVLRSGEIQRVFNRKMDQTHVLQQVYRSIQESSRFTFSHRQTDITPALYSELGLTGESCASLQSLLSPLPRAYPENILFFRRVFHSVLAEDAEFVSQLASKDIASQHFFAQCETVLRMGLSAALGKEYTEKSLFNLTAVQAAKQYGNGLKKRLFRGQEVFFTVSQLLDAPPLDQTLRRKVFITYHAAILAGEYVSALTDTRFVYGQMLAEEQASIPMAHTREDYGYFFEAGFDIAATALTLLHDRLPQLTLEAFELRNILKPEVITIAKAQAKQGIAGRLRKQRITFALTNDAKLGHIPAITRRLLKQYAVPKPITQQKQLFTPHTEETKAVQQEAAMQAALAETRTNVNMGEVLSAKKEKEAIDAAQTIIDFFKNLKLDGVEMEQEVDRTGGDFSDDSNEEDQKRAVEEDDSYLDFSFDVYVGAATSRRMKARDIMRELQRGKTATFKNEGDFVSFMKIVQQHQSHSAARAPVRSEQMRYLDKGRIVHGARHAVTTEKRMAGELIIDEQQDKEREKRERDQRKGERKSHRAEAPSAQPAPPRGRDGRAQRPSTRPAAAEVGMLKESDKITFQRDRDKDTGKTR